MATALTFDTWACIKELEQGGFTTKQAEAQTKILSKFVDDSMATKQDIKELDLKMRELDLKIEGIKKDIELLKRDIIIKLTAILGSMTVGCFTVLGSLIVFLR